MRSSARPACCTRKAWSGSVIGHAPEVAVVSTVGAGDSMVGGLVAALSRHATPADALRLALACGSGTSQQPGTELFDPAALPGLQAQVNIQLIA
ncbi:PfkB family carbohydrate kinase [Thiomonas sp. 13-64-67]|uniref:PfkB family carbohydrate kinase n=1 Tax=Thiomonas sp. 13-64-67 TaxID=1970447 RepID=UPI00338FB698